MHAAIAAPQPLRVDLAGTRRPRRTTGAEHRRASRRLSRGDLDAAPPRAAVVRGRDRAVRLRARRRRATPGGRAAPGRRAPTAHVTVSRLDLGRLPRALVPPALGLGGTVDADAAQRGRPVAAHRRRRGRRRRPHPAAIATCPSIWRGSSTRGRARGRLRARGLGAAAVARFDLPGAWPPRNQRAPIALDVDVSRHRSRGRGGRDRRRRRGAAAAREGARAGFDPSSTAASGSRACGPRSPGKGWRSTTAASAISISP